ncbi:MAG: hypothetical protein M3Y81_02485 [Chloroflexota bacterium]|nr:hypothetical protein [Chloroflexota bacterium]
MTSFLDVIRPLTDQLKSMSDGANLASQTYTGGTTRFRNHINDVGSLSSPIIFLGKGADAFITTVNHNADLSTQAITRLSDFQAACDDARKTMEDMSVPYDNESRYLNNVYQIGEFSNADPYNTYEFQYFLDAQGYTTSDTGDPRTTVVRRIREDTLPGLCFQLDRLLNTSNGQALLESNIDYAVSCIQGDFQSYQSKRHAFLDGALRSKEITKEQHSYYSPLVDSIYEVAMGAVNAIAKNMKTGYDSWDEELVAAANNFLAKVRDIDTGKLAQLQLYTTIDVKFHDPRTQALLYAMSTSPYGAKVVQYLLNAADCSKMSPCGDALIVWQDGMPANTGAFNDGTVTTLNTQDFNQEYNPNDLSSLATLAGYVAHEAIETYYSRAHGIPANTLPMDYLADYVHQIVTNQMLGNPIGYFPSYQTWVNDPQNPPDGSDSGYTYVHDFHENGDPAGGFGEHVSSWWWSLGNSQNANFAGNPMGLSPSLLQNNSTLPGWDITKYWNSNTSSFHAPTPKPHPTPTPTPQPMPEPVPVPGPQPRPHPTPTPDPTPNPQPGPHPTPTPTP